MSPSAVWERLQDEVLYEVAIALITGTFWAAIAASLVLLWSRRQARRWSIPRSEIIGRFLFRRTPQPPVVILATGTRAGHRAQTGVGQVIGLALVAPSIRAAYGAAISHDRLYFSEEESRWRAAAQDADLIVIGGPKSNLAAEDALARLRDRGDDLGRKVTTRTDRRSSHGRGRGGILSSDAIELRDVICWDGRSYASTDDDRGTAYGLVIRCASPWNPRRSLTLIIGSGTHGTEAAARGLAESPRLRSGFWRRRRSYAALVSAKFARNVGRTTLTGAVDVSRPIRRRWAANGSGDRR